MCKTVRASCLNQAKYCPAFPKQMLGDDVRKNSDQSDKPAGEALARGTAAHKFMEICICESLPVAQLWIGTESKYPEMEAELTSFWNWWYEDGPLAGKYTGNEECELEYEYKLESGVQLTGHIDYLRSDTEVIIVDWKYGAGQKYILEPIEEDYQMLAYALLGRFGKAGPVSVYRVQVSDREYQSLHIPESKLDDVETKVAVVANRVAEFPDKHITGPHCQHCLCREQCPERLKMATKINDLLLVDNPGKIALTSEQAKNVLLAIPAIESRCAQLKKMAQEAVNNGAKIEHEGKEYKKYSYTTDVIINPQEMLKIAQEMGLDPEVKITKSAIENACKAKGENLKALYQRGSEKGAVIRREKSMYRWR